jgi:hypothetical protein
MVNLWISSPLRVGGLLVVRRLFEASLGLSFSYANLE